MQKILFINTLLIKSMALTLLPFCKIVFPYDLACSVEIFKILNEKWLMPPAVNDHSASDGNNENQLVKVNIPILLGDNYELI